ncbi:1192_t:CDS:10 [Ambispora gerdemannii]|uniref:RNA helicase n=1 Tax=Ambispora gerdemannii TaxID=144530 RepID=A0A9N8YME8_9GLOM|nr:1192_t:CDS:10 [Ambispora gerdemannii]
MEKSDYEAMEIGTEIGDEEEEEETSEIDISSSLLNNSIEDELYGFGVSGRGVSRYKVPTPIQRKTIPLIINGNDVVGMARTGSGKTAAFLIPMLEKLKAHSAKVGARAIILSPSRELALQTQKVCNELAKYTDLRTCILVGGDSLEDHIIATPGRLLHLLVEMDMDLDTVEYIVFDEADRLFEMGFSVQLHEILHKLPSSRQTLLFSATLPKTLVDFAKAGLQDPTLIRLDVESKISSDLQTARKIQISRFRDGMTNLLIVTDVAARGIDIPILENVINYDFVDGSKIFVHRVGRTARAGRPGWAYSLVTPEEFPHLLDLQLFLSRPLLIGSQLAGGGSSNEPNYTSDIVIGGLPRDDIDSNLEWVKSKLIESSELETLKNVANNGYKQYSKSRASAASETDKVNIQQKERLNLINSITNFRPNETIFEIGNRGIKKSSVAGLVMKQRRNAVGKAIETFKTSQEKNNVKQQQQLNDSDEDNNKEQKDEIKAYTDSKSKLDDNNHKKRKAKDTANSNASKKQKKDNYRDEEYYIPHYQMDANTEKGYSVTQGTSFAEQAQKAILDPQGDEASTIQNKKNAYRWDAKKKNFVRGLGIGADNKKLIKTESGIRIPATYKSGRFKEWQQQNKLEIPRTGERELGTVQVDVKRYRHNKITTPKPLDPLSKNYPKKLKKMQKSNNSIEGNDNYEEKKPRNKAIHLVKTPDIPKRGVKSELKTVDQIRKQRKIKQNRRAKNSRPSSRRKNVK